MNQPFAIIACACNSPSITVMVVINKIACKI
jgi:hypothetical protein